MPGILGFVFLQACLCLSQCLIKENHTRPFQLYTSQDGNTNASLLVWINGIPGHPNLDCTKTPLCLNSNLLALDVFKEGENEIQLAYTEMLKFGEKHPNYINNGVHIFGQSYGAYVAAIVGNMINNNRRFNSNMRIELLSVGFSSPIFDLAIQMLNYTQVSRSIVKVPKSARFYPQSLQNEIYACRRNSVLRECDKVLSNLIEKAFYPLMEADVSPLNIKHPTDLILDKKFLPSSIRICLSAIPEVQALLDHNIPVLIYSGNDDYITNSFGITSLLHNMSWERKPEFKKAYSEVWFDESFPCLLLRNSSSLTQAIVLNSGHLPHIDNSKITQRLIRQWLDQNKFKHDQSK